MRKSKNTRNSPHWTKPFRDLWARYNCWELMLIGIGLLSFVSIVVILFMPIGKGPTSIIFEGPVPPVSSTQFRHLVSNWMALPEARAPRPQTLINGDAIDPTVLQDIDRAQHSVDVMAYIWKDGHLSDELIAHLLKRQRSGVQVRILLDAYGALKAPSSKLGELQKAGGKIATFHTLL